MAVAEDRYTVFVSYSWDTDEHKQWVRGIAEALHREPGIDVTFDQFDLWAGKDLTHFMERGLECERVVVVSTPAYVRKSRERVGGVGYECSLITADLVKDMKQDTFIPVLRAGEDVPPFLVTKLWLDFRDDTRFEESMQRLIASIRREPEARRPEKRFGGDLTTNAAPSQTEVRQRERGRTSQPQIVLEGRFDHREMQGHSQGMYLHNVGDAAALEVQIEPLGREPKWMMFGKVAVVRPDTDPAEVAITFVDAADVFEIGGYISVISTFRGEATITDGVAAHDAHPLRISYHDREGTEYVNEEYELHFHESKPFITANAYYEVQRRQNAPAADRILQKFERIPIAAGRPRIRLSRARRAVEKPVDTKAMMKGLHLPLFDVRNTGEEEAFDVVVTLHPKNDLTVTLRCVDHLPAGGEKTVIHSDLRYEQNGAATEQLNLWIYIATANMFGPKIGLPLRASVTYRDRRNRQHITIYDLDGQACTFIADEE
jgi:hypothetical protein